MRRSKAGSDVPTRASDSSGKWLRPPVAMHGHVPRALGHDPGDVASGGEAAARHRQRRDEAVHPEGDERRRRAVAAERADRAQEGVIERRRPRGGEVEARPRGRARGCGWRGPRAAGSARAGRRGLGRTRWRPPGPCARRIGRCGRTSPASASKEKTFRWSSAITTSASGRAASMVRPMSRTTSISSSTILRPCGPTFLP